MQNTLVPVGVIVRFMSNWNKFAFGVSLNAHDGTFRRRKDVLNDRDADLGQLDESGRLSKVEQIGRVRMLHVVKDRIFPSAQIETVYRRLHAVAEKNFCDGSLH